MDEELTFGQWLRRSRKARDLTQTDLAGQVSCALGTIRKLEADELRPSKELAARLVAHFGVPEGERAAFVAYARGQADTPLPLARENATGATIHTTRAGRPHNLPAQPTSFIGREREVAAVRQQLLRPDVRLLTLTGPGGTGKTRLALRVAADLLDDFRDGVWFVDLAPVRNPALVAPTIATTLGLQEIGGQALADRLRTYLRDRQLLLVLDNFEQVVAAAPVVAELLAVAPQITVLATSRVVVGIYGEHDVGVSPLAAPDPAHLASLDALRQNEAVQLFLARAQAATAGFALTPANARVVAEICQQLEGLPLAIELAATRLRHLPVENLLARLSSRLTLLTGGARTLPARQQTLRDTLAWSYELLEPGEQRLFRRLGVFVGGWALEAADAVLRTEGRGLSEESAVSVLSPQSSVLDGLASLVDQSLVRQSAGSGGEPWFTMLETVREYALEQLAASGEADAVRRQHAAYYLALGQAAEPELRGPQQATWMERLLLEHNNLRAVLAWSQSAATFDAQAGELGLRLAVAVWEFWSRRGLHSEGRRWLAGALSHIAADAAEPEARRLRARVLSAAGNLAEYQLDAAAGRALLEESLALFQELGDTWGSAYVLLNLGLSYLLQGDLGQAETLMEQSLATFRTLGDRWGIGWALAFLMGVLIDAAGSVDAQDHSERALVLLEESLAHFRAVGDLFGIATVLGVRGRMAAKQGDDRRARVLLAESLALLHEVGGELDVAATLREFAGLVAAQGQQRAEAERATRLYAAAEALEDSMASAAIANPDGTAHQRTIAMLRTQLGEATFATAWAEGRAMTVEQAIAYALADDTKC